jgi:hypothetical protein
MCEQLNDVGEAEAAYHVIANAKAARKAFNFVDRYKAANGRRPSLSSIVMLWQQAEAKLAQAQADLADAQEARDELRAKVDEAQEAGGPL